MTEETSQDTTREAPLRFQSGGAVRPGAFYIEREADSELLNTLLAGEYCYVLAPRQMGKSSLRVRAAQKLREHGVRCATVDLQGIGSGKDIKINDWYHSIIGTLNSSLGLNSDLTAFWMEQGQHLTDPNAVGRSTFAYSWSTFLEREVLAHTSEPIVIFVDEIDSVLSLPFSTDDFFAAIRSAHESRPEHPQYNRLTFCLMGVAAPNDLIRDTTRTPFNIGKSISLEDFTWPQTQRFLDGLSNVNGNSNEYLRAVFSWANGQPYMTHKLCQEIAKLDSKSSGQSEADMVRKLVETTFLQRGRTQDSNLRYAEDRFDQISSPATKSQLLHLYRRLLQGQNVEVKNDNPAHSELELTGLAGEKHDANGIILQRRNEIFATVFDEKWIREKEGERLFREALAKWLEARERGASGQEYLLRGEALEEGLTWWKQRDDVTKEEREFLLASQELARTKAVAEARWAKRLRTLSGLLIGALIIAIALAAIAFKQKSALVASRSALEKQAKELQRSQDELIAINRDLEAETTRAVAAENAARNNAAVASDKANQLAKTAEELKKANSDLSRAREVSAAISDASRKQLYLKVGDYELQKPEPSRAAVYYAASYGLIDKNRPHEKDPQILSQLSFTSLFVHPLIKGLSNASLSPDGKRLISNGEDAATVRLWNMESGAPPTVIEGEIFPLDPWSPNSERLVTSAKGNTKLWDARTGDLIGDLHGIASSTLYWSKDGKRLVSLGDLPDDRKQSESDQSPPRVLMTLWNAELGKRITTLLEDAPVFTKVAWTEDSKHLAIVDKDGNVQLWDADKGKFIRQLTSGLNVDSFDQVPDSILVGGRGIFVTNSSEGLKIWNADGSLPKQLSKSPDITTVELSNDSERIITLDGNKIRIWDTNDGSGRELNGEFSRFHTMGWGDSLRIITVGPEGKTKLWNGATGVLMKELPVALPRNDSEVAVDFLFLGHRDRFALGLGDQGIVQLWDSNTGQKLPHDLHLRLYGSQALRWSDDEKWVVTDQNTLVADKIIPAQIWDAQTGKSLSLLPILDRFNSLYDVSWSSRRLITNQLKDGSLQVWKLPFSQPDVSEMILDVCRHSGYMIQKKTEDLVESENCPRQP